MDSDLLAFYKSVFSENHGIGVVLARKLGLNPCSVTLWLQGRYRSPRLEEAVPLFLQEKGLPWRPAPAKPLDPLEIGL